VNDQAEIAGVPADLLTLHASHINSLSAPGPRETMNLTARERRFLGSEGRWCAR
jgi:hypothetical protein